MSKILMSDVINQGARLSPGEARARWLQGRDVRAKAACQKLHILTDEKDINKAVKALASEARLDRPIR